jgi:hypothetical protein
MEKDEKEKESKGQRVIREMTRARNGGEAADQVRSKDNGYQQLFKERGTEK